MLDHVVCSREKFSFQMCLERGGGTRGPSMVAEVFLNIKKLFQLLLEFARSLAVEII